MEYGTQPTRQMPVQGRTRRRLTETKQAFKTTEFWIYVVIVLAILLAGLIADGDSDTASAEGDGFGADKVWLYVTLLTIGYMISRGLAKAGSHDPYTDEPATVSGESLGDRVKAAAQVLKEGESGEHGTAGGTGTSTGTTPGRTEPPGI